MKGYLKPALGIIFTLVFTVLTCINIACSEEAKVTASSSESELYPPGNAFDGNLQTRWSSQFSDPQWLKIDLGAAKEIVGLTIKWEAAYGKSYEIQLSEDDSKWKTVYETTEGDGATDEVYFRKTTARYVKIFMKERGTTWGYSIFEVMIKGADEEPIVTASSFQPGGEPANAFDGDMSTEWRNDSGGDAWITVDLRKSKALGGIQVDWGLNYAKSYEVLLSDDGNSWRTVFSTGKGRGKKKLIYFDATTARYIKVSCRESDKGSGYSLKEITLKGPDEAATPQRHYEVLAEDSPPGYYPKWVGKQQAYWTIVGVDGDNRKSLLCEDGSIEPYQGSFSIMPYLFLDGKLVTSGDAKVSQSLEKKYLPLPTVTWDYNGIIFTQRLFASGERQKSASYAWYTLENKGKGGIAGKLFVTVRPFQVNPPWQYGGLSEIRNLSYDDTGFPAVKINGAVGLISLIKPAGFGAIRYKDGDIVEAVENGNLPSGRSVDDPDKYASGALQYDFKLPPGKKAEFFFAIPLHGDIAGLPKKASGAEGYFSKLFRNNKKSWESKLDGVKIDLPDKEIVDTMRSNLAYIFINKDLFKLQPGSRNYNRAWMRDGALMSAALMRTGHRDDVKEFLDWIASKQYPDGMIPFMFEEDGMPAWCRDWKEYDSQGEFIFSIYDYYRFTGDKKFLEGKWPNIEKALKFLVELRKRRLTDEFKIAPENKKIFYGILPESNSHEGYFPAMHSYWDDFWALKGWKDAGEIAGILGKEDAVKWIEAEEVSFRKSFYDSMDLVMKSKNISYIPGCAEKGDLDATSTAIGIFPCGEYQYMPQPQAKITFDRYYNDTFLPRFKKDWKGGFTPYEIRSVSAMIMMGERERAFKMLKYFQTVKRPREWNHWAEVVAAEYRMPQYIGDMPHSWIGGEYICAVRNMLVYEDGGKLVLAAGIPAEWALTGKGIRAENLPTYYGPISFTLKSSSKGLKLTVTGKAKPPKGFVFRDPRTEEEFTFSGLPFDITATGQK